MSILRFLLVALLLASQPLLAGAAERSWITSAAFAFGETDDPDSADFMRVSFQKQWRHSWFTEGAWYLGGYWDAGISRIKADNGHNSPVFDFSLTPMFRFQRDASLSSGVTPFAEAGIGIHVLSDTHIGDSSMATALQFGSLLGLGIGFGDRGQYELTYQYSHLSNGDIKKPNDGVEAHLLKLGYNFY